MLSEIKESYKQCADLIPGWRKMSRSELCFKYIEAEADNDTVKTSAYLSAIIYKFLNVVSHNYKHKWFYHVDAEVCYDWVISSIMYVLKHRVWMDPKNKLYGDINAPEKCINVKIYAEKMNYTVFAQRQKRNVLNTSMSIDSLSDDCPGECLFPYVDEYATLEDLFSNKIIEFFNKKDYFNAFLLDAILTCKLQQSDSNNQIFKKLKRHLNNLDTNYITVFSNNYGLDTDKVIKAYSYVKGLSYKNMINHLKNSLLFLRNDKELREYNLNCR